MYGFGSQPVSKVACHPAEPALPSAPPTHGRSKSSSGKPSFPGVFRIRKEKAGRLSTLCVDFPCEPVKVLHPENANRSLCVTAVEERVQRRSGTELQNFDCNPCLLTLAFAMEKRFECKASFEVQAVISKTKGNKTQTSPQCGCL